MSQTFDFQNQFPTRARNDCDAVAGVESERSQPLALQPDFGMSLSPEEIPGQFYL